MDFDKKLFISMFYDAYVNKYMNCNLQCHTEFFKVLKDITKKKKPDDILRKYEYMKQILVSNDFVIPDVGNIIYTIEDIHRIIYTNVEEYPILASVKDVLLQDPYAVLNYIYGSILKRKNTDNVLMCVKYLLDLKRKDIFTGNSSNTEVIDILFNIITYVSKILDKDLYKYVTISQGLMYFKSNKKILKNRVRILYITLYVMLSDSLDKSNIRKKKHSNICDYLYVICEKDYKTMAEIQNACQLLKIRRYDTKNVKVDKYPEEVDMNIVKRDKVL